MSHFKKIPGFLGYEVSQDGTVRRNGKRVKSRKDDDGYDRVDLYQDGKRKTRFVHSLVNSAHNGGSGEVDHNDKNRSNNNASNLESVSRKENMRRTRKKS